MNKVVKTFQYGQHEVRLETGAVARQADGAVLASMGDTMVLVTVVGRRDYRGHDFLPLTVDYEERTYAAGKIPGGFFKREGRPSEHAVLTCRLIDRPIRPLFAKGFMNEVQVVVTVMSVDPEISADIVALIGTSAAIEISGLPFNGPMGAARVGYVDGEYVLNPGLSVLSEKSSLDLVVAGTESAVLMVESQASILTEEQMLGAVMFGHQQSRVMTNAIRELGQQAGKVKWDWNPPAGRDQTLADRVAGQVGDRIAEAYRITDKVRRLSAVGGIRDSVVAALCPEGAGDDISGAVIEEIQSLEKHHVRSSIIAGKPRIDGRDTRTVRPISIEIGVLPRTHGSALFTRGETQAIVVATLGTERDSQIVDALEGDYRDGFMLHYNFPPYCVGETGRVGSPKRREIGHGRLAKRSIMAVLPTREEFPYTLRVVSEITESNGSSSMASVCGTSLALMDAGVCIKEPVAGVAMGLIKEEDSFAVLTDILGDEDHLGSRNR